MKRIGHSVHTKYIFMIERKLRRVTVHSALRAYPEAVLEPAVQPVPRQREEAPRQQVVVGPRGVPPYRTVLVGLVAPLAVLLQYKSGTGSGRRGPVASGAMSMGLGVDAGASFIDTVSRTYQRSVPWVRTAGYGFGASM